MITLIAVGAVAIAGCTSSPPRASPTLSLMGDSDCPTALSVRLTNNDNAATLASYLGFKMVDANGTIGPVDPARTAAFASAGFPRTASLDKGESAEGAVAFSTGIGHRPYTLLYDRDGLTAEAVLPAPPAGEDGCAQPAARTGPTLSLIGEGDCPLLLTLRLTNNDNASAMVNYTGFKVVDANGTVSPANAAQTESLAGPFPRNATLGKGESAQGDVAFSTETTHGPYTLKYEYAGLRAQVGLVAPPPGQDGCTPPPPPKPSFVLTSGTWNNGNLTVSFASITNGQNISPTDLTYLVQASDGTAYFSGSPGMGSPVANVTVSVGYWDNANIGKVSNEDNIRITVSPATSTAVRGGSLKIFYSGEVVGFINQLP
jgi:hypothetical protein